jgi:hypothetical protein
MKFGVWRLNTGEEFLKPLLGGEVATVAISGVSTVPCLTKMLAHVVVLLYDGYYLMYSTKNY